MVFFAHFGRVVSSLQLDFVLRKLLFTVIFARHYYIYLEGFFMIRLSVNVNKIATIRNARGGNNPNLIAVAQDCERFGAQGITVHPRPDERHIRYNDVLPLRAVVKTEFNIEGYPDDRFMKIIATSKPEQATLVPDAPDVLTSNAGWDTVSHHALLRDAVSAIKAMGVRVSVFVDASAQMVEGAAKVGADRVELYTGPYATMYSKNCEAAIAPYLKPALVARDAGLGLNAGHDLSLANLAFFSRKIPALAEVSIGHALVCDALYVGLENAIKAYLGTLRQ